MTRHGQSVNVGALDHRLELVGRDALGLDAFDPQLGPMVDFRVDLVAGDLAIPIGARRAEVRS